MPDNALSTARSGGPVHYYGTSQALFGVSIKVPSRAAWHSAQW